MFNNVLIDWLVCLTFFGIVLLAACSDAGRLKIPNVASLGLLLLYPVHVLTSPSQIDWLGAGVLSAALFLGGVWLFTRGALGGGDVKLLSVVGLWAGPSLIVPVLVLTALAGGVLALFAGILRYLHCYPSTWLRVWGAHNARAVQLPYGVAIAFGGAYVGLQLLPN